MGDRMLWDKDMTQSVRASKVRDIHIQQEVSAKWSVRVVLDDQENFDFGSFRTKKDALIFVDALHAQIALTE